MAKKTAQLDRDIAQALGLPAAFMKKWRSKIAAYKRAVADVEDGYTDDGFRKEEEREAGRPYEWMRR